MTRAVNREDSPYTSLSTAENQKVSEKQYARAPAAPLPKIAAHCAGLRFPSGPEGTSLLAKKTTVRYSSRIVSADATALQAFASTAACMLSPKMVNSLTINWKKGFPGGWPTSSLYDEAVNSPQSQYGALGSMVERYVTAETMKTRAAVTLFQNFGLSVLISVI